MANVAGCEFAPFVAMASPPDLRWSSLLGIRLKLASAAPNGQRSFSSQRVTARDGFRNGT
jgi:hypothetical protein